MLAAALISNLGDGLRLAALPLLAVSITTSPELVSWVVAAQFLPWVVFAPVAASLVDGADRRRVIITTQLLRGLVLLGFAWIVFSDSAAIWHLYVVAFLLTAGEMLVDPAVVATVPRLVAGRDLDRANGRLTGVETVSNDLAGASVGGVLFAVAPWLPFLLDALSYLGSIGPFRAVPAAAMRPERRQAEAAGATSDLEGAPATSSGEAGIADGRLAGWHWLRSHPFLWRITRAVAVSGFALAMVFGMLVLLVREVLGASEAVFGLVLAAAAVGATASSQFASGLAERRFRRNVVVGGVVIGGASSVLAAVVAHWWQLLVVWCAFGAGGGLAMTIGRGFLQRHTPNELIGRTSIASRSLSRSFFVVGAVSGGVVASLTSVRATMVLAGLVYGGAAVMWWHSFRYEPPEPAAVSDTRNTSACCGA